MKVYGADICIDCRNYKAVQRSRGFAAEYVDITENTMNLREFLQLRDSAEVFAPEYVDITENTLNLREFLHLRDSEAMFATVKEHGGIGIPLFVREDGEKTFDLNEALAWLGQSAVREDELPEKYPVCGTNGCK